jgi:DNA ligase-1
MKFADVVAASEAVAATTKRSIKVQVIADVLARAEPDEVAVVAAVLAGEARQGRIGVGWRTLTNVADDHAADPTLSVIAVDAALTELAGTMGSGSNAARQTQLQQLFAAATAPESAFLRRLLSGEVRQGALEGVMLDAIAKAAGVPATAVRRACMLAGDIPTVAALALSGGADALTTVGLQVLRPVLPMLASTATDVAAAVAECGMSSVEWKLDGIRIQAHRSGDEVRLFTRNLNDVTQRLPAVVDLVRALPAASVVLDGEVLGFRGEEGGEEDGGDRPDVFQSTMSRFGRHEGGGDGLALRFFDCLHIDGTDLLDEPLATRQAALERVAGPWRIPTVVTDDAAAADAMLAGALGAGHEGVMVKSIDSRYEAGRRGKAWRKVKPVHTFDLVVLGAEWGHGRRNGWLSNLHLGARVADHRGSTREGFVMVGKTFKGLTDALLTWQTEQFLARESGRDGIVVWVRPEIVVEIAIDGVQRSTRYPGGVALRFARVKRYRPDKSPEDTDTIDAVRALLKEREAGAAQTS